jgi:glycerophosphoryl diester phosphodiesterase
MGFTILIALALTACSAPTGTAQPPSAPAVPLPRIVAHRGASKEAPENTLRAFRRAYEIGAECVELDMHVTSDGEVVVIHDDDTLRMTGVPGKVADQTLADLKKLDFRGEQIPTIAEALATIPDGRTMFLEIKTGVETVPTVARAIRAAPHHGTILLQAFDPDALAALAKELHAPAFWDVAPPEDERRKPLPYPLEVVDEAKRRGFEGLALLHVSVGPQLIEAVKSHGMLLDVWTVNDRDVLASWMDEDVRWIETDLPGLATASKPRSDR